MPLADVRDAAERRQIERALEETGGQIAKAASLLAVSRTTLWEKMTRLGLADRARSEFLNLRQCSMFGFPNAVSRRRTSGRAGFLNKFQRLLRFWHARCFALGDVITPSGRNAWSDATSWSMSAVANF